MAEKTEWEKRYEEVGMSPRAMDQAAILIAIKETEKKIGEDILQIIINQKEFAINSIIEYARVLKE